MQEQDKEQLNTRFNNPFIHGTNSSALIGLGKTKGRLISPIDMLTEYLVAPLSGEIEQGGLNSPAFINNTSFGILEASDKPNSYTLDEVIRRYATARLTINKPTIDGLQDYINKCMESNFSLINILLIKLSRAQQFGVELTQVKSQLPKIQESANLTKQFYYFILCLAKYSGPLNTALLSQPHVRFLLGSYYTAANIKSLISEHNIDVEKIYKNPKEEDLKLLSKIFNLPAGNMTVSTRLFGETVNIDITTNTDIFNLSIKNAPNVEDHSILDENQKKSLRGYINDVNHLFMGTDKNNLEDLLYSRYSYENPLQIKQDLLKMQPLIKQYLESLESRLEVLEKILAIDPSKVKLSSHESCFLQQPFPLVLFSINDVLIKKFGNEYRANGPVALGQDVYRIAVNTYMQRLIVESWLKLNKIQGVDVVYYPLLNTKQTLSNVQFITNSIFDVRLYIMLKQQNEQSIKYNILAYIAPIAMILSLPLALIADLLLIICGMLYTVVKKLSPCGMPGIQDAASNLLQNNLAILKEPPSLMTQKKLEEVTTSIIPNPSSSTQKANDTPRNNIVFMLDNLLQKRHKLSQMPMEATGLPPANNNMSKPTYSV